PPVAASTGECGGRSGQVVPLAAGAGSRAVPAGGRLGADRCPSMGPVPPRSAQSAPTGHRGPTRSSASVPVAGPPRANFGPATPAETLLSRTILTGLPVRT